MTKPHSHFFSHPTYKCNRQTLQHMSPQRLAPPYHRNGDRGPGPILGRCTAGPRAGPRARPPGPSQDHQDHRNYRPGPPARPPRTTRTIGIIDQDHHHARQDRPRTTRTIGFTDRTIDPSLDVIILIPKWEGKGWSWSQREAAGLVNIVVRSSPKEGTPLEPRRLREAVRPLPTYLSSQRLRAAPPPLARPSFPRPDSGLEQ